MPLAIVDKRRQKANSSEVMNIIGDVRGKHVILLDDMVDTGGSLCHAAQALMEIGGAQDVTACASHGVLSGPAIDRINSSVLDEVIFLDTIPGQARRQVRQDQVHLGGPHVRGGHQPHLYGDLRLPAVPVRESGDRKGARKQGRVANTRPSSDCLRRPICCLEMEPAGWTGSWSAWATRGEKYENTRHNVGFMVADELGERQHAPIQRLKYKALTNVFTISGQKVLVMKPVTFMNLSGEAVRQAVDFYKVAPDHVLVVSDDTALAVGRLRIRRGLGRGVITA